VGSNPTLSSINKKSKPMHTKQIRYECLPSSNFEFERSGINVVADIWKNHDKVTVNVLLVDEGSSVSQLVLFEAINPQQSHPLSDELMVNNIVRQRLLALLAVVPFSDEIVHQEEKGVLEWYTYIPFGAITVRLDVYELNDSWKINATTGDFSSPFDEHMMNHSRVFSGMLSKIDFPSFIEARQELISRFYIECAGMVTDISTAILKSNEKDAE